MSEAAWRSPVVVFAAGMVAACVVVPWAWSPIALVLGAWLGLAFFVHLVHRVQLAHLTQRPGRAAWLGVCCGVLSVGLHARAHPAHHPDLSALDGQAHLVRARVLSGPERAAGDGLSYIVESVRVDDEPREAMRLRLWTPSTARPIEAGEVIEARGKLDTLDRALMPGAYDAYAVWGRRGVVGRMVARQPAVRVSEGDGGIGVGLERARTSRRLRVQTRLMEALGETRGPLVAAMLLGDRSGLRDAVQAPFRITGTSHLLAISGLHMGVLGALLWVLCRAVVRRMWPREVIRQGLARLCALPVGVGLGLYVWGIGAPASALRAWVMLCVGLGALVLYRRVSGARALAVACVVMLAWSPGSALEPGAQLSVGATLAILAFWRCRPGWARAPEADDAPRWRRLAGGIGASVGVSWSAGLGTLPVVLSMTGEVPVAGFWVNLWVVPLVSVVVFPLMVGGALVWPWCAPAGEWLMAQGADALLWTREALVVIAQAPGASWSPGVLRTPALLAVAAGCWAWILSAGQARRLAIGAALLAVGLGAPGVARRLEAPTLRVHFIPVGQGDATLIEWPDGGALLIDAGGARFGPDPGASIVAPYLRRLGYTTLDAALVTHADWDHLGGMFAVAQQVPPQALLIDPEARDEKLRVLHAAVRERGGALVPIEDEVVWRRGGATARVMRPAPARGRGENDRSLTVWLRYGAASVLLPGDLERAGEAWLLARGIGRTTLLKAGHHGSNTSSGEVLLERLEPKASIVSAARRSPHGHPHPDVLDRHAAQGVEVWQTACRGLIVAEIQASGRVTMRSARPGRACGKPRVSLWKTSKKLPINTR